MDNSELIKPVLSLRAYGPVLGAYIAKRKIVKHLVGHNPTRLEIAFYYVGNKLCRPDLE